MNNDLFNDDALESSKERAGEILSRRDLSEERHAMKKTAEDVYQDFLHNMNHPFMYLLTREAEKYARTGEAFVCWRRINYLIDKEGSEAWSVYYNDGDTWRQTGNALIWKALKEKYPDLYCPGMRFGCKGEKFLLRDNPGKFEWLREIHKKRAEKEEEEE